MKSFEDSLKKLCTIDVLLMVIGFFPDITLIGLIIDIPIGIVGLIMCIIGLATSGKKTLHSKS